jgi:hypothetical protein
MSFYLIKSFFLHKSDTCMQLQSLELKTFVKLKDRTNSFLSSSLTMRTPDISTVLLLIKVSSF